MSGWQDGPEFISIHALREEGDASAIGQDLAGAVISIHALREEGDVDFVLGFIGDLNISIHALREEGDDIRLRQLHQREHFYPRPPRGGRQTAI